MRLADNTSLTLLSTLFRQRSLPICLPGQTHSSAMAIPAQAPVILACHGGGPMPMLGDPGHASLIKTMSQHVPKILQLGTSNAPRAIVLVTAHWEERRPTISNGSRHQLYYDYNGFPPEAYKFKYDAPGSPEVAQEVYNVLKKAGLNPAMDSERGMDIL
jgi:aromatic ring-opening dioxygenase catalytic subunit (LigB family)